VALGDSLLSWAEQPGDIDAVAARVGVAPSDLQVRDAEGRMTTTRIVYGGLELPFFVAHCAAPAERRELFEKRRAAARHDVEPRHFAWIEQGGDERRVRAWLHGQCPHPCSLPTPEQPVDGLPEAGCQRRIVRRETINGNLRQLGM
jgi:hypothetical protein